MNALKPDCNMRHEGYILTQLTGNLAFVDVVSERIRDKIVRKILHVVLRTWLGAGARVAGPTISSSVHSFFQACIKLTPRIR